MLSTSMPFGTWQVNAMEDVDSTECITEMNSSLYENEESSDDDMDIIIDGSENCDETETEILEEGVNSEELSTKDENSSAEEDNIEASEEIVINDSIETAPNPSSDSVEELMDDPIVPEMIEETVSIDNDYFYVHGTLDGSSNSTGMPTQKQIWQKWTDLKINLNKVDKWSKNPNSTDGGRVDDATMTNAVNVLNFMRYVGGLPSNVTINDSDVNYAQKAAYVNWLNNKMSHSPTKPSGVSEDFYNEGKSGASQSNLYSGSYNINLARCVVGWISDQGITSLGHRIWALSPAMKTTGFGAVPVSGDRWSQYAMYVYGFGVASMDKDFYSWPAQNMPIELYTGSNYHFSLTLNGASYKAPNMDNIKITMSSRLKGKTWVLTKNSNSYSGNYLASLGAVTNYNCVKSYALDFHSADFSNNDTVHIKVEGLETVDGESTNLEYDVNFFSVADYKQKVESVEIAKTDTLNYVYARQTMSFHAVSVLPEDATDKSIVWKVRSLGGDGSISSSGVFTGTQEGDVEIYAQSKDGGAISNSIKIHVYPAKYVEVELSITNTEFEYDGNSKEVIPTINAVCVDPRDNIKTTLDTSIAQLQFFSNSTCTTKIDKENIKNAGTYYVRAMVPESDTYDKAYSNVVSIVIDKLPISSNVISVTGIEATYEYTTKAIKPTPIVKHGVYTLKTGTDYSVNYENNIYASEEGNNAKVIITAISKNYKGALEIPFCITKANLGDEEHNASEVTINKIADVVYNGQKQEPIITVKKGGIVLKNNIDYTVEYSNNLNAGRAKVKVIGKGSYSGIANAEFVIIPAALNKYLKINKILNQEYTGTTIEPEYVNASSLIKNADFDVSFENNTNPGTGKLIFEGKGNYLGNVSVSYKIDAKDISKAGEEMSFELSDTSLTYNGKNQTPSVIIKHRIGEEYYVLREKTDYTLKYSNNKNAATETNLAKVTITGKGKYKGTKVLTFAINKLSLETEADITFSIAPAAYIGKAVKPSVKLFVADTGIQIASSEYTLEYVNNVEATKGKEQEDFAKVCIVGKDKNIAGTKEISFEIGQSIANGKVEGVPSSEVYDGKEKKPEITVKLGEDTLATDSIAVNYENNTNAGTAKIVITAKAGSGYVGTISKNFKIAARKLTEEAISVEDIQNITYNGKNLMPDVVVKDGNKTLGLGVDYTVSYGSNKNAGTGKVIIKGKGNYSGSITKTFVINPLNLNDAAVYVSDAIYTGKAVKAAVKVFTSEGVTVGSGEYTLSYADNVELSNLDAEIVPTVTITAKDKKNITGTIEKKFRIAYKLSALKLEGVFNSVAYTGNSIVFDGLKLTKNKAEIGKTANYEVVYDNNTDVGTAKITIQAKEGGAYTGSIVKTFKITAAKAVDAFEVTLDVPEDGLKYTGISHKPTVIVKDARKSEILTLGTDFTVSYSNNKNVSTAKSPAKITITGKGKYTGSVTKTFMINW